MKMLFVNRNVIVSIFTVMLSVYGVQGVSYGQETTLLKNTPVVEFSDRSLAIMARVSIEFPSVVQAHLHKTPGVYGLVSRLLNMPDAEARTISKAELAKMKQLKANRLLVLDKLGLPPITDITGLEHAIHLTSIDLNGNEITDITSLSPLTQLTILRLWGNRIIDITSLVPLTQLTILDLGGTSTGNFIRDITPLAQLTQLRELGVASQVTDLGPLTGLTELRELDLDNNQIRDLGPLTGLTELRELHLSSNQIRDLSPLAGLNQLTELYLTSNHISDLSPLAGLTQLRTLYILINQISNLTGLEQLLQLKVLNLSYNQIRYVTPLAQMTALTELDLSYNQVRDVTPLAQMDGLTKLQLHNNQINDVTPLAQLVESLSELDLGGNRIRDVSPLAKLIYLEGLYLGGNPITTTYPLNALLDENPDLDIDIEVVREAEGPKLTASTSEPLTVAALNGGIVRLTLSSGGFGYRTEVRDALTLSGITGITFHSTDIERISDTEITIELTFTGSIDKDAKLIFTLGPRGIQNYNGSALTAEIPVSMTPEGTPEVTEGLVASTPVPLTPANLDGSVVTLTLGGRKYARSILAIRDSVSVTGIAGVTIPWTQPRRKSDTQITIELEFDGNMDTDSTLTFTVGARAIDDYNGPALTAEISVTINAKPKIGTESQTETGPSTNATVSISPASVASPAVGQRLEFSLNITGGDAVAGYQATVRFDDTALRYVSGANGDYLPAGAFFVEPKVKGNLVQLNAVSLAGESNGDGTLATLTFEVIAVKASTLTLSDVLLTDSAGKISVPQVENGDITKPSESERLTGDINGDGTVNIADLVLVASNLGETGQNDADVNGDGTVNIADLVLVAGALGNSAAAPSLHPQSLEMLTATEIKKWLSAAQHLGLTDTTSQRGLLFLEQLFAALTPKETALLPNFPNPFNPETWIPYQLAKDAEVTLHIYAVDGTLVRTLTLGHQPAGMYQNRSRAAYWDGRNAFGEPVASGVYFYTLTAGDFTATRKMLIQK